MSVFISHRRSEPEPVIPPEQDVRRTPLLIHVDPDTDVPAHVVSDTAAIRPHVIGTIEGSQARGDGRTVVERVRAEARDDVDRPEYLLGNRHRRTGLHVIRRLELERVLHVPKRLYREPCRAERDVADVDVGDAAAVVGYSGIERREDLVAHPGATL